MRRGILLVLARGDGGFVGLCMRRVGGRRVWDSKALERRMISGPVYVDGGTLERATDIHRWTQRQGESLELLQTCENVSTWGKTHFSLDAVAGQ
jgi:hypothetical protein